MRINWFSPLPPAKTEIASYTVRLLPFLQKHAEVILWTDSDKWDRALEDQAIVRRYQPDLMAWADLNRADATIYHIGNHPTFHGSIWQVSKRHPGIVVLHDMLLQHFFATLYWQVGDLAGYLDLMETHYGQQARSEGQAVWDDKCDIDSIADRYPLTYYALENALGVVTHTREGFEKIKHEKRWAARYAPLPYSASPCQSSIRDNRVGMPPYRLIVFGHLGLNRRVESLVKALAAMPEKEKLRLDIYGEHHSPNELRGLINSSGLQRLVTMHGYVSDAELDDALAKAHLAINLRYPSMGEASASQLKIWDYALPSLVTKTGWYEGLPEDAVAFVRPEHEIADIQRRLRAFLDDPARFAKMGENGRRILESEHNPDKYTRAIIDFVSAAKFHHSRDVAFRLADRAGSEMGDWMDSPLWGDACRKVAEEINALTDGAEHGLSDNRQLKSAVKADRKRERGGAQRPL
jgi:glycosyltransferase involved in cell wall biosynthesis